MFFVDQILDNKRVFVDVGSNIGTYSYYFKESFNKLHVFEPLSELTYRLTALKCNWIDIVNCAL